MSELSRSAAAVRFFGDALDPDELSALLGAEPDHARRKGDRRTDRPGRTAVAETGSWLLDAPDRVPGDLDAQVEELLAQLTPDLSVWRSLAERFEADVSCGLFMERRNEMISLSTATLAALAARGLAIDFDIYDPCVEERGLLRHPQSVGGAGLAMDVKLVRTFDGVLRVEFALSGPLSEVKLAPQEEAQRRDELWRTTCFEVFLRAEGETYFEFNFSPSTSWAAYRFDSYRQATTAVELTPPRVGVFSSKDDRLELLVELALGELPELADQPWRVGASAIIEDTAGGISYWAIKHPPGKPDFHHPDSFALALLPDPA